MAILNNNYDSLVSVLMPVYNVKNFVEQSVESILSQSYNDIELIIVDDCSTDGTYELLLEKYSDNPQIIIERNQCNLKIAKTLNYAFSLSNGNFIARMDGDDLAHPNRIEKLVRFLLDNSDYDLVGSFTETIDEDSNIIGNCPLPLSMDKIKKAIDFRQSPIPHHWVANRRLYDELIPYRAPGAEDFDFLMRAITSGYKITNIPEFLSSVRIRRTNTAMTIGVKQMLIAKYCYKMYKERLYNGCKYDSFTEKKLVKYTSVNPIVFRLHLISNKFLSKALCNAGILRVLFLIISVLSSPFYQSSFLLRRYRYKKILD